MSDNVERPLDHGDPPETVRYLADAVVTGDRAGSIFQPGAIDVTGDRVAWVGSPAQAPEDPVTVRHVGGILMPGLVNTHAHTAMTLLRGVGDGLPLERWLNEAIWPHEGRYNADDAYWGMSLGCEEMLRCGITTTCEMYLFERAVVDAAADAGIRTVMTPGIFDIPGTDRTWPGFLEAAIGCYELEHGRAGLVSVGFGPHSAYLLPDSCLEAVAAAARERAALVQIHLAETTAEGRGLEERHGCSVPEYLGRLGFFEARVLAAHSVWLSDDDLDLYRRFDVAVAHCPGSNGKLGSGSARLVDLLARGIRVGLGTDGPASNDDLTLWEEMRLAPLTARASAAGADVVTTAQALHLATRGGADALGLETGSLEAGRLADVIRLENDVGTMVPVLSETDLLSHLVWSTGGHQVTDVWVGGRHVVSAGACRTIDGARARREVRRRAARVATEGG